MAAVYEIRLQWAWIFFRIVWNCHMRAQGQRMTLTSCTHKLHVLIKTTIFTSFRQSSLKLNMKSCALALSSIWPCRKNDQGQPKIFIWTILVVLGHLMLHNQVLRPSVNWFWRGFLDVYIIYGHDRQLGQEITIICINFHSCSLVTFHMNFLFREKTSFNSELWVTSGQHQRMTLTFDTHLASFIHC